MFSLYGFGKINVFSYGNHSQKKKKKDTFDTLYGY